MEVRPRSHVDTPEWQSFEARMLARRAERRAQAARVRRTRIAKAAATFALLFVAAALGFAGTWIVREQPIAFTVPEPPAPPAVVLRINEGAPAFPPPSDADNFVIFDGPSPSDVGVVADQDGTTPPTQPVNTQTSAQAVTRSMPVQSGGDTQRSTSAVRVPPSVASRAPAETAALEPRNAPVSIVPGTKETGAPQAPAASQAASGPPNISATPQESTAREQGVVGTAGSAPLPALMPGTEKTTPAVSAERADNAPAPASRPIASPGATSTVRPAAPRTLPDSRLAVRDVLERYRLAYERLDAAAAGAVWPGVDRHALARAFDSLQSQQIDFRECRIFTAGATARASCAGRARAIPKIGTGAASEADRTWEFSLVQKGNDWQITKATVR